MSKYRSVKKNIERLMGECFGPEFREARAHLEAAARAVSRAESKSESRDKVATQGWVFDTKTSSMRNLSARQVDDAIERIEGMIESEKKKSRKEDSGRIMFD